MSFLTARLHYDYHDLPSWLKSRLHWLRLRVQSGLHWLMACWPFWLIFVPTASFWIVFYVIEKTGEHHLISRINIENIGRFRKNFPIAHIFKHISWAITTEIFFLGAVVLCIGFCLFMCCVRLKRCQNRLYFWMYFLPIGFAFLWWIVGVYLIFSENIPGAAATINNVLFFNDSRIEDFIHIVDLRHAIHIAQIGTYSAFMSLALAAAIIMWPEASPAVKEDLVDVQVNARHVAEQVGDLRSLVIIGSSVLFVGIVSLNTFVSWRASLVVDYAAAHVNELGKVLVLIWVAAWTLCLGLIYALCAVVLRFNTRNLLEEATKFQPEVRGEEWLDEYDLKVSFRDFVIKAAALLGPLVTTAMSPFEDLLTF